MKRDHPTPLVFKPRAIRRTASGVIAHFGRDRVGTLVNIGTNGALLRLIGPATVGEVQELTLLRGSYVIRVPARVLRVSIHSRGKDGPQAWNVAVEFDRSSSTIRPQVADLLEGQGQPPGPDPARRK